MAARDGGCSVLMSTKFQFYRVKKKVLEMMVIMAAQQCKCLMSPNCKFNVAKTGKYTHIHTYAYYSTGLNLMHIVKHEISMWHRKKCCGRKDSSVAKSTVCSCSEQGLGSQHLHGGSQLSVTPVPRALTPLQTFSGMVIHMMHRQTYRKKNKNNNNKKKNLSYT